MNAAHLHIALNHFPVVGMILGLALLIAALLRRSPELARVAAATLVAVAVIAIPVYLTGEPAEEIVEHLAGVSESAIEAHESAGLIALIGLELVGALSLLGLVAFRDPNPVPRWFLPSLIALSTVVAGWLIWTAYLGGHISHPEARPQFERGIVLEGERLEGETEAEGAAEAEAAEGEHPERER